YSVERDALNCLLSQGEPLNQLSRAIRETFEHGGRVIFCGCGATGRLSLSLEALWRESQGPSSPFRNSVISFIAGGDYALVRSIENFEDHSEYGARQLHDLDFNKNDLLIASSEGGETPFVIGAVQAAAEIGLRRPWFLFCNPTELLKQTTIR